MKYTISEDMRKNSSIISVTGDGRHIAKFISYREHKAPHWDVKEYDKRRTECIEAAGKLVERLKNGTIDV